MAGLSLAQRHRDHRNWLDKELARKFGAGFGPLNGDNWHGDDWRCWVPLYRSPFVIPIPGGGIAGGSLRYRRLLCRQHWWMKVEWEGQAYLVEPRSRWYTEDDYRCYCMYFDVSGRLLREGAAVIPVRHPGELQPNHRRRFITAFHGRRGQRLDREPVRTHEIYILDEHLGAGLVELTNEHDLDYFSCTARHLDLVSISFMRDVGLRWRRKASFRNHCRQALCIPSIVLPYMELKDMLYFRRAGRECWKPGMSGRERWKIIWPQRQL